MIRQKKEPWRIAAAVLAIAFIACNWIRKDIRSVYSDMPAEQMLPLIVTTVGVTLLKIIAIAFGVWLIKKVAARFSAMSKSE